MTSRDRIIVLFLPAVVVFFIYVYFFGVKAQREVRTASERLAMIQAQTPTQEELRTLDQQMRLTRQQLASLEQQHKNVEQSWNDLAACFSEVRQRPAMEAFLNAIWFRHRLTPVQEKTVDSSGKSRSPESLEHLRKQLDVGGSGQNSGKNSHFWSVRLVGRFGDLHAALKDLARSGGGALPIGLTLEPVKLNTDLRVWNLVLWLFNSEERDYEPADKFHGDHGQRYADSRIPSE